MYKIVLQSERGEYECPVWTCETLEDAEAGARRFAGILNKRVAVWSEYKGGILETLEPEGGIRRVYAVLIETAGGDAELAEFTRESDLETAEREAEQIARALRRIRRGKAPATRVLVKDIRNGETEHEVIIRPADAGKEG